MAILIARFATACLILCLTVLAAAKHQKPVPAARKEDLKYVKCAVCTEIAKELSRQVDKKRSEVAPKQLTEYQIIELAENICNLKKFEGEWILHEDIVEEGDRLVLVRQEEEGECLTECKTIEKACQEVMGYHDTDVAEYMFRGDVSVDQLSNFLCKDLSNACRGKTPSIPKDRVPGEKFTPKSSKDAEIERIMKSMSDMPGAPGMKVYSKDDLMNGMPNFNGDDDDEDDDEENDEVPMNKGKFSTEATGKYKSQIQSFAAAMKSRTVQLLLTGQKHMKDASDRFRQWWSGTSSSETIESAEL